MTASERERVEREVAKAWHQSRSRRELAMGDPYAPIVDLILRERAAAFEAAATVARATVCDVHLPTGVRIYGNKAADAIDALAALERA